MTSNNDRMSLTLSVDALKSVVEAIEETENGDLDEERIMELAPQLDSAMENLKEGVERRIQFLDYCALMEKRVESEIEYLTKKKNALKNVQASVKKHTMFLLETNPSVEFTGERKKFKIYNNGGKLPLEWTAKLQEYKHIIDPADLGKFPSDMIKEAKVFVLDKEKLEGYLSAGGSCEGVKALPRGKHLRIV